MTIDYTQWLPERPLRFDDNLVWLYERFLVGSLAIDASKCGGNFDQKLGIVNSNLAEQLIKTFNDDDLTIDFVDRTSDVATKYLELLNNRDEIWKECEFYICYRTKSCAMKRVIESLREYEENNATALADEANETVKRRFYEVDSVFRHIRNALAHGCVSLHSIHGASAVLIFDVNDQEDVTAVASLTFERLRRWYKKMCSLARTEL